jgi:hypothetical protein
MKTGIGVHGRIATELEQTAKIDWRFRKEHQPFLNRNVGKTLGSTILM